MPKIRETCVWDKEELCTDKTAGASGGLSELFLSFNHLLMFYFGPFESLMHYGIQELSEMFKCNVGSFREI